MKFYGGELPKLAKGNEIKILETCRDIHQGYIDWRKRNTKAQRWDKYWVDAYNFVIKALKSKEEL